MMNELSSYVGFKTLFFIFAICIVYSTILYVLSIICLTHYETSLQLELIYEFTKVYVQNTNHIS